jgi:hypothetical protein
MASLACVACRGNGVRIDHVVIFVPNLRISHDQFSALGFKVIEGGKHESTENALVIFADQTYIELIALKPKRSRPLIRAASKVGILGAIAKRKDDINWRLMQWVCNSAGPIDWCIRVNEMEPLLRKWNAAGATNLGTRPFQRLKPDGAVAEWTLGASKDFDLPFLITDLTDPHIRVPICESHHPNGALGISHIWLSVSDRETAARKSCGVFKRDPSDCSDQVTYLVGDTKVELVDGAEFHGKFSLGLAYEGPDKRMLDLKQTSGASIWMMPK